MFATTSEEKTRGGCTNCGKCGNGCGASAALAALAAQARSDSDMPAGTELSDTGGTASVAPEFS